MGGAEREQSRLLTIGRQEGPGRSRATVDTAQRCGRATLTAGGQGRKVGTPAIVPDPPPCRPRGGPLSARSPLPGWNAMTACDPKHTSRERSSRRSLVPDRRLCAVDGSLGRPPERGGNLGG